MQEKIYEYDLTERHARAMLKLNSEEKQLEAAEMIHSRGLNVTASEKLIENMLEKQRETASLKKRSVVFKDVRLFVNTINKAIEMMKAAGINADSKKIQDDDFIEYIVRIPTK